MAFLTCRSGLRLRLSDRGTGDRAVLLVHGWKMSHRVWDRTVAALAPDTRVVAFDLRGMGESDKPPGAYDFAELSADVGEVVRTLGLREVTLVGWSMGVSVALEYLRRDGHAVARLVLVNGPIRLTVADDFPHAMPAATLDAYVEDVRARWPERERAFTAEAFLDPHPDVVDWIHRIALQTPLDVVLATVGHQARLDHRAFLATIPVPTLAVYGRHDPYYPAALAGWIADRVPRCRAVVFERSAHFPFLEEADAFAALVRDFAHEDGGAG